jgi:hypothetical protein
MIIPYQQYFTSYDQLFVSGDQVGTTDTAAVVSRAQFLSGLFRVVFIKIKIYVKKSKPYWTASLFVLEFIESQCNPPVHIRLFAAEAERLEENYDKK